METAQSKQATPRGTWPPRRGRLTAGIMATVATGAFESLAVSTVLPAANRQLHDLRHYGLVFSAFMLTNLIGVVVGGRRADSAPPDRILLTGTVVFSGGLLVTGTAGSMLVLALGRALQGLGAGGVSGLAMYAVRRCYPEQARPRMLALLSTAWMVPGLLGPSAAAGITALVGWRWVFLGLVPIMPAAALLALPALRAAGAQEKAAAGTQGHVIALGAAVLLALAALAVTGQPLQIALACAAAVAGLPALARVLPAGTARLRPGQPAAVAFILLAATGYFGISAFVPLALTSVHRASIWQAGLVLTGASVCWTGGTWVQAHLADKVPRRRLLLAGTASLAAGVAATGYIVSTPQAWFWLTAVSWAAAGFGMGLTSSIATFIVLHWARQGAEGHAAAAAQLANLLGGAVGTGLAGVIVSAGTRHAPSLVPAVRVIAASAVAAFLLAALAATRAGNGENAGNAEDPGGPDGHDSPVRAVRRRP